MTPLDQTLAQELARWEAAGLRRTLANGRTGVDFVSNDYLGLARHPEVVEAARRALLEHGAGARASRLLGGGSVEHERAERAAAEWLGTDAALLFPSGYQANLGLVGALVERGDALFSDEKNHASLVDAARLSRARVFVHRHLDLEELERALERARTARRRLVLTEGVFSMDGDAPDLAALARICERHDAWLAVDEAHAAGLLGPHGRGASAAHGSESPALAARIVTGGKALGVGGAFVVGSATLREHLLNRARSFLFTTAPPPATAAALARAIELAQVMDAERELVLRRARDLAERLGLPRPAGAIVPYPVGDAKEALELAGALSRQGLDVRAVRPPTVPSDESALRIVVHAFNTDAECDDLARALAKAGSAETGEEQARPRKGGAKRALAQEHGGSSADNGAPAKSSPRPAGEDSPAASKAPVKHAPPTESRKPSKRALRRALFVVGTDTGVGKTVVAALLLRAAKKLGPAAYWKPVQTGTESDTKTVAALAEAAPHELLRPAWQFDQPASPHEAAARAGHVIDPRRIEEGLGGLLRTLESRIVIELAGGLLVPYATEPALATQADWLERIGAPLVLVARSGLGTLNHTLLTLEALRARHLEPRALFLVGEPHASNRETLAKTSGVERIFELPPFAELGPRSLADWLERNALAELFEA